MTSTEFVSDSPAATEAFAAQWAQTLMPDTAILLYGDLGAGKTTFVRGLARGLGITEPVRSPTFTLTHEYTIQQPSALRGLPFFHIDLYRIETAAQLHTLGLDEVFERGGVAAIEWAERLERWGAPLPVAHLWAVRLIPTGDAERQIVIECLQKPPAAAETTP
ncbi:tRNA (adenosine(37)-N6)-threonylcarbamoyltransferase complex ATPase subunit type 1 TsaE [Synechococcus sp. RC10A2]|jgi:tRNA threonylcarbamoyladenosine biosynthesis protein TsaE|uniref:tRNA (adenosine(37)-N6)-threonylcarbamoyltransferase complex ATPase subunit type 1 TsaE n=1 Tax=Synechococcus sp. RC10A2 TaxID=2964529 RepID=UPI0039C63C0E